MRDFTAQIFGSGAARDYAVAGVVIAVLAVFGVQQFNVFVDSMRQNVRIQTTSIEKQQPAAATRNFAVKRSVLDDTVATGSIANRPVILDPCTGQVKSK